MKESDETTHARSEPGVQTLRQGIDEDSRRKGEERKRQRRAVKKNEIPSD